MKCPLPNTLFRFNRMRDAVAPNMLLGELPGGGSPASPGMNLLLNERQREAALYAPSRRASTLLKDNYS